MKRAFYIFLVILLTIPITACKNDTAVFRATVLENNVSLLVEPEQGSDELRSSDKIAVHANDAGIYDANGKRIELSDIAVGQTVEITYGGLIAESYPAQITADKIKIIDE